jgi:hypothetical protein
MTPRPRRLRLATSALALFHLLVAGLSPWADARLEASEAEVVTHIEAERSRACAAGHDHVFCQVCRTVSLGAGPAPAQAVTPLGTPAVGATFLFAHDAIPLRHLVALHGPRAPPQP